MTIGLHGVERKELKSIDMKKILLLGSGELGKEFVIAAKRAGQYVVACDRYEDAPPCRWPMSVRCSTCLTAMLCRQLCNVTVPT